MNRNSNKLRDAVVLALIASAAGDAQESQTKREAGRRSR